MVRRLREGKALSGPDEISAHLLKAAPSTLAVALAALFNGSLWIDHVPSRARVAWVPQRRTFG